MSASDWWTRSVLAFVLSVTFIVLAIWAVDYVDVAITITYIGVVVVIALSVLACRYVWIKASDSAHRMPAVAGVCAAGSTALLAIFAMGLFHNQHRALQYQIAQGFGSATTQLAGEVVKVQLFKDDQGKGTYIVAELKFTNASAYDIKALEVHYRLWIGSGWMGMLRWYRTVEQIPFPPHGPLDVRPLHSVSGFFGSQTAVDLDGALQRGMYFLVQADWENPGHGRTCRSFVIRVANIDLGIGPTNNLRPFAGFVASVPDSIPIPNMPPCRGSAGIEDETLRRGAAR